MRALLLVAAILLGSVVFVAEKTAAAVMTVPYSARIVADGDLDGDPATGDWGGAASTAIPLENGEPLSYGTATLLAKHNGTFAYFRIEGYIDVPWVSAGGEHFWLGLQMSPSGTAHHGTGTWDGIFFGLWNGGDYAPSPTYPPRPVDTNGFSKPPVADGSQDAVGAMGSAGTAIPYRFTAEWRRALDTGDPGDIAYVPDGATALSFFVTTDSDGEGSEGGAISHNVVTNSNTLIFGPTSGTAQIPEGALACGPEGAPVADGRVQTLEYHTTYFDPNTKITVSLTCEAEAPFLMHAAVATPWDGWASLLVQAREGEATAFNAVRIMHGGEGAVAEDAYTSETQPLTRDVDAGGTEDVSGVSHGHDANPVHVFEFSTLLRSTDVMDSLLDSVGPYTFSVQYNATAEGFGGGPEGTSGLQVFYVDPGPGRRREPTAIDFLLGHPGNHSAEPLYLVTLRNATGYPVPDATVYPFVRTAYGFLDLGPLATDADGVAAFSYRPYGEGEFLLGVGFPGGEGLSGSVSWKEIESVGVAGAPATVLRPVEAIVAMALAGVWATYAYSYFLVRQTFPKNPGGLLSRLRSDSRDEDPSRPRKEGTQGAARSRP